MTNKSIIIGSDSFIAQKLIANNQNWQIKGIARSKTSLENEIITSDFFSIDNRVLQNIDVVINFAAIVHQPKIKDIDLYDRINHELPLYLANLAKDSGAKQYIQMSTIAVYGQTEYISQKTTYNPNNPYGKSKLEADFDLLKLQNENFKVSIVRPSMVYGGGKAPGNMLKLINLAQKGIPLPFKGVQNQRQFCNIHLLVDALSKIIEKQQAGTFLVADREGISTHDLLNIVNKYSSQKIRQFQLPKSFLKLLKSTKPGLYQKLYGSLKIDVEKTITNLKIESNKYSIEQGIREMVKSIK